MTPPPDEARERRALTLVELALEQPAHQREDWIAEHADDDQLRERALALLARAPTTEDQPPLRDDVATINLNAARPAAFGWLQLQPGDSLGDYRIRRELGRGGMGVVYQAERTDASFELVVAIKSINRLGRPDLTRRFDGERQILARLRHPNIANVLDGGTSAEGLPFLVMEYVEGEPLDVYCDRRRLSLDVRLQLFLQVCEGVEHAHRNLVVHRDLKPANILVTGEGQVKLLDFGIAKLVDEEGVADMSTSTRLGGNAMTPEYASPEQVLLEPITTLSDVYSLGVVLYELLSGFRPYQLRELSLAGQIAAICEREPSAPSERVEESGGEEQAAPRSTSPNRLASQLRGDLDTIVLAALRKDPTQRYQSVGALAEDVRLHLQGEPVKVRPLTPLYLVSRFMKRHRLSVAAATLALLSLTIGGVVSVAQGLRASREAKRATLEANRATLEANRAKQMTSFLATLLTTADPVRGLDREASLADLVDFAIARLPRDFGGDPGVRGSLRRTLAGTYLNLGLPEQAHDHLALALEEHLEAYGEGHLETVETQRQLAVYEESVGNHQGALERLEPVLAALDTLPDTQFQRALALDLYGTAVNGLGRTEEALESFQQALALFAQVEGADYEILNTSNNIAVAQLGANDPAAAAETLKRGLERANAYSAEPFPLRARMTTNLGLAFREQGAHAEAEPHLAAAADMLTQLLGPDHPETLLSRIAHSQVLTALARLDEADREMGLILAAATTALPADHYIIPYAQIVHAEILVRLERGDLAEPLARAALESRRTSLPEGHWLIASSETTLGAALLLQKRRDEAIEVLEHAYPVLLETRGPDFGKTVEARGLLDAAGG